MARFITIKSRRKACIGKGKQAKCKMLTVKRKVRVNPKETDDDKRADITVMIRMMHQSIFEKGSTILDDIHVDNLDKVQKHLSQAFEYLYR